MPEKTPCAHCGRVGFVRWERVLVGVRAFVDFYCGKCEHTWRVAETGERRAKARARRYTETPDHSRSSQLGHDDGRTGAPARRQIKTDRRTR